MHVLLSGDERAADEVRFSSGMRTNIDELQPARTRLGTLPTRSHSRLEGAGGCLLGTHGSVLVRKWLSLDKDVRCACARTSWHELAFHFFFLQRHQGLHFLGQAIFRCFFP